MSFALLQSYNAPHPDASLTNESPSHCRRKTPPSIECTTPHAGAQLVHSMLGIKATARPHAGLCHGTSCMVRSPANGKPFSSTLSAAAALTTNGGICTGIYPTPCSCRWGTACTLPQWSRRCTPPAAWHLHTSTVNPCIACTHAAEPGCQSKSPVSLHHMHGWLPVPWQVAQVCGCEFCKGHTGQLHTWQRRRPRRPGQETWQGPSPWLRSRSAPSALTRAAAGLGRCTLQTQTPSSSLQAEACPWRSRALTRAFGCACAARGAEVVPEVPQGVGGSHCFRSACLP